MKNWITGSMSALLLATLLAIPSGCGSGATEIEKKPEAPPEPGHAQALEEELSQDPASHRN